MIFPVKLPVVGIKFILLFRFIIIWSYLAAMFL